MTCEICGGRGYVESEDDAGTVRVRECRCAIESRQRERVAKLLEESGITQEQLRRWSFGTFDIARCAGNAALRARMAEIVDDLRSYAQEPIGWRVLQGMYGVGKTHLAYAVAAHRARVGSPVYVATVPDLLDMLRRGFDDDSYDKRLRMLQTVPMLVLDDLGTENATPFAVEKLHQVVDARYRTRLPMVVTTNRLLHQDKTLPGRIVSRLLDRDLSVVWTLPVGDYRRVTHADR